MFRLAVAGAAVGIAAGYTMWTYWSKLVFRVRISCLSTTFTASEADQNISRIEVSLPDNYKVEDLKEPFPKPVSFMIKRDNIPLEGFCVSEVYNYGTRKLVINAFGCLKTAGVYTLIPVFENKGKIVFDGELNCTEFEVEPSQPCTLKVLDVKREDDFGSQSRDTLYSGGKAQIFVEAKDEFDNVITDDVWEVEVDSEYVMDPVYEFDGRRNCHVITVDCEKEGQTNLNVKMINRRAITLTKHFDVDIVQAPLSLKDCIISREYIEGQVGQDMRIEVQLYDIYYKPFQFPEGDLITHKFSLFSLFSPISRSSELNLQENISLKVFKSDINVCQLKWIPMVAGQRVYTVYYDGASLGKGSAKVTVNPGPLRSIAIIKHISMAQEDNTFKCYTTEQAKLFIKGLDEFKNEATVDPEQWSLAVSGDGGLPLDLHQTKSSNGTILQFSYSFDNEGTYNVTIQNRDEQSDVMVPESFELKIIPAPLDHSKCRVERMETEKPVFQQSPIPLKIKLELFNCMSKPFYSSKLERNALEVKVNGEVSNTIAYNETSFTDPPNTVYITVDVNTYNNSTNRIVEVYYTSKRLGGYIDIDVTHVLPFSEDDYFDFDETNVNINEFSRKDLIGDDYANIDKINRVLNSYTKIRPRDFVDGFDDQVIIDLSDLQESQIQKVHEMLFLLVEGLHYRTEAYRFNSERGEWKSKSEDAYSDINHLESQECSAIKEKYAELMDEAHKQASEAIFKFFNYARTEKEIDLHGQLVANENLLEEYKKQLCTGKKYNRRELDKKSTKRAKKWMKPFVI